MNGLAASAAQELGYKPGGSLEDIVKKLGGRILLRDALEVADSSSGSIRIKAKGDFEIFLARHTGPIRDRFTIAHELGHYVLHYLWPKAQGAAVEPIEARRYGSGRVEWEANWFAAGFLMPANEFKSAYRKENGRVTALADRFGVSEEAVRIRIRDLGLE